MASSYETSDFRKGLKILWDGVPWVIVDFQHVKPGKGNAFTRTRLKNLLTGAQQEVTMKSGERCGDPEIEDKSMSFLYKDGEGFHFMDQRTYDQVALSPESLGDVVNFLVVAFALYIFNVKFFGWLIRVKKEETIAQPALTKDQELLTEIRDLLRQGQAPAKPAGD